MTLDELCGRTGLSRPTVQRYVRIGIIPLERGSYERIGFSSLSFDFDEEAVACVEIVRNLTRRGVPLGDIQAVGEIVRKTASKTDFASTLVSAFASVFGVEQALRSPQSTAFAPLEDTVFYDRGDASPCVGGTAASPPTQGEESMTSSPQWRRSIGSYTDKELRALKFRSMNEVGKAIDLIWSHADLRGLPRMTPDGITFIVPEEAVKYFEEVGLKFIVSLLANREDIPPERFAELRRKYGM